MGMVRHAAEKGHTHILKFMTNKLGVDWTLRGAYPLHVAAERGHVAALRVMVSSRADLRQRNGKSLLPIHIAAASGHRLVIDFILSQGASFDDAKADSSERPGHKTAFPGIDHTLESLIKSQARPGAQNAMSEALLDMA